MGCRRAYAIRPYIGPQTGTGPGAIELPDGILTENSARIYDRIAAGLEGVS